MQDGKPGGGPQIQAYAEDGAADMLDPQLVVRELYQRYRRQLQRWADYRNLGLFLSFCALFLGVLYAQRSAQVAYQVHSTLESVVAPERLSMQSTDEVYGWLQSLLQVGGAGLPRRRCPCAAGAGWHTRLAWDGLARSFSSRHLVPQLGCCGSSGTGRCSQPSPASHHPPAYPAPRTAA
jgi:hypothetical protein